MNDMPSSNPEDLQFERVEVSEEGHESLTCKFCDTTLADVYFEVNTQPSCEKCRYQVEHDRMSGSPVGRVTRALLAGALAAFVGALLYYGVAALTGYEFGLIAIVVGLMVGFAVRWGAHGRGGWVYQTIAMLLTYLAIVSTYIPLMFDAMENEEIEAEAEQQTGVAGEVVAEESLVGQYDDTQVADSATDQEVPEISLGQFVIGVVLLILFAMVLPFLAGFENIMGLIIIGIGLYEAWKINKYQPLLVEGPFNVGKRPQFSFESLDS